jgi:hypothetical protein
MQGIALERLCERLLLEEDDEDEAEKLVALAVSRVAPSPFAAKLVRYFLFNLLKYSNCPLILYFSAD